MGQGEIFVVLQITVQQFIKNSANIYRRGPVQFKEDLCKLTANTDGLLFQFIPVLKEYGEKLKIIHPCPYYPVGALTVHDQFNTNLKSISQQIFDTGEIVVSEFYHNVFTATYPTGDYKVIFRISDDRNETIYQNTALAFFRGSSLFS